MKKVASISAEPARITANCEPLKIRNCFADPCESTILKGRHEIVGISRAAMHNWNRVDIGGYRFFSRAEPITSWWEETIRSHVAPAFDDKILKTEGFLTSDRPCLEVSVLSVYRRRVS